MRTPAILVFVAVAFLFTACSSGVTAAQISQVKDGMKADQVTALLGQPTNIEQAETTGATGQVYYYRSEYGSGKVVFVNDTVFHAEFTAPGAHS